MVDEVIKTNRHAVHTRQCTHRRSGRYLGALLWSGSQQCNAVLDGKSTPHSKAKDHGFPEFSSS